MNMKTLYVAVLAVFGLTACDDTTDTLGDSLTHTADKFELLTDTFGVSTRSVTVDSVLATTVYPYIGNVKDTETGSYVTSSFSSQCGVLDALSYYAPKEDSLRCDKDEWGNYIAEQCFLNVYFNSFVGDTLNTMKMTVHELATPLPENKRYYSNYDLVKEGYLRNDGNEMKVARSYTYQGMISDEAMAAVTFDLNKTGEYVDSKGNRYKNYGSYLLNSFYRNPDNFKTSYSFIHKVCPGFYFEHTNGIGNMGEVAFVNLVVSFKAIQNDSICGLSLLFPGTEEVMQTSFISNDRDRLKELAADESCTYLKSPAGIFTEVTLPIQDIKLNHENDTISSVKLTIPRYNNTTDEKFFTTPTNVLMIPKDSLFTFFENKSLPDSKLSYLASFNSSSNTYTFNNISNLVNTLWSNRQSGKGGDDWNKVILLPVNVMTNSSTTSTSTSVTAVTNEIGLKSTRLVKGTLEKTSPLKVSVIYNKFRSE